MDIKPYDKTIKELFLSGRQFVIPRFQREYSWDKKNYQEFFDDMMNNLVVSQGKISIDQYFLGTMLFVGNFAEGREEKIQVVDGQQRLTTVTILFSAMSDRYKEIKKDTLSEQVFKYIMTKDDNGDDVRIIQSKTHYPFFSYFIQDKEKKDKQQPNTEEELCIKDTYDYLYAQMEAEGLKNRLKKRFGAKEVENLEYVDILKALRDQVLNATFVSISTGDREQANKIFEILNAKGKRLADVDLIKNRIFEVLNKEEPVDFADDQWEKLKRILQSGKENIGMATFYRHYWISKYKKTSSNRLYEAFLKDVHKKEEDYKSFLKDMVINAENYRKIVSPTREDYANRKEYFSLVQSLNALDNYFNITQVRIALLSLYDIKSKRLLDLKLLKSTILYLENFHFAYNAICSGRANKLEKIYSDFAIKLRQQSDKTAIKNMIDKELISPLEQLFPTYEEFKSKFVNLTYSKKENSSNLKTKYAINKLWCLYEGKENYADDGSIEHIYPECKDRISLNIGNLILLERVLNKKADNFSYEKKHAIYGESKYLWMKEFVSKHIDWSGEKDIKERSQQMAEIYYTKIFNKTIS